MFPYLKMSWHPNVFIYIHILMSYINNTHSFYTHLFSNKEDSLVIFPPSGTLLKENMFLVSFASLTGIGYDLLCRLQN